MTTPGQAASQRAPGRNLWAQKAPGNAASQKEIRDTKEGSKLRASLSLEVPTQLLWDLVKELPALSVMAWLWGSLAWL